MLQQRTKKWKETRNKKITGTDAAVIAGHSEDLTPLQLWEIKKGLRKQEFSDYQLQIMNRGTLMEPDAVCEYEKLTGIVTSPQVSFHKHHDWAMASTDGVDFDNSIVLEVKCGEGTFKKAEDGVIPLNYLYQIQHYLFVTNIDVAHYYSYNGEVGILKIINRDDEFIREMKDAEEEFYFKYIAGNETPPMNEKDYYIEKDAASEIHMLSNEWKDTYSELKILKEREESLRKELIKLSGNRNTEVNGVVLTKYPAIGNVDYSQIPELKDVSLDKYRKSSSIRWRVSKRKET